MGFLEHNATVLQRSKRIASRFYKPIDIMYMSEVAFDAMCGNEAQQRTVLDNAITEDVFLNINYLSSVTCHHALLKPPRCL